MILQFKALLEGSPSTILAGCDNDDGGCDTGNCDTCQSGCESDCDGSSG